MPDQSEKIRKALEEQEAEQIRFKARNTTPLQRILWVEEMLKMFAPFKRREASEKSVENQRPI